MEMGKIRHDLALAYAQSKVMIALERGELAGNETVTEEMKAAYSLAHWYRSCLDALAQLKDKEICDQWADGLE